MKDSESGKAWARTTDHSPPIGTERSRESCLTRCWHRGGPMIDDGRFRCDDCRFLNHDGRFRHDECRFSSHAGLFRHDDCRFSNHGGLFRHDDCRFSNHAGLFRHDDCRFSNQAGLFRHDDCRFSSHAGRFRHDDCRSSNEDCRFCEGGGRSVSPPPDLGAVRGRVSLHEIVPGDVDGGLLASLLPPIETKISRFGGSISSVLPSIPGSPIDFAGLPPPSHATSSGNCSHINVATITGGGSP